MTSLSVTEPLIRARLRKAHDKRYQGGVLGLRAKPVWDGAGFDYNGTPVTVIGCPSVLAIWEAIDSRDDDGWTVVLTDVGDDDLGDTVLAHLLDGRLITPDPWDALRANFSASTIEPALYRCADDRAIAGGLLGALSSGGYTPAPGGVLTRDHAMSAVARDVLGIVKGPEVEIDTLAILEWSRSQQAVNSLIRLRDVAGDELSDAFGAWLAGRSGRLARPITALLNGERIADLVPLGVIAGLFATLDPATAEARGTFLGHYSLAGLTAEELAAWYANAHALVAHSLTEPRTVLDRAATVVNQLRLGAAAASSELLPHGLDARLTALARAVLDALPQPLPENLTGPLIGASALARIETLWNMVEQHFLAATSLTPQAFSGAVRLLRWLADPAPAATGLAGALESYVGAISWADTALVTARRGAETPIAAEALRAVIAAANGRRSVIDRHFAAALADSPKPAVRTIERVLPDLVIPIAKQTPVLLLVLDGLSLAAANDLVIAAQRDGWIEISAAADSRRAAALAVLPTLTRRSRCSLLCGELREGADNVERSGFLSLIRDAQLEAPPGAPDPIFHKRALDAIPSGLKRATDVDNAIADTAGQKLVAAVLNYVDDTLHHTDPGGTDWNLDTITHLRALLAAARNAGRTVVITSDHGHLIEYGTSAKADRANTYGQRAHGDFTNVDPDREIIVEGTRVLTENRKVVLAVDNDIRYGARNAGYHGGGTPAEAVVPVIVLVTGQVPEGAVPVVGAEPSWWHASAVEAPPIPVHTTSRKKPIQQESLFDDRPSDPTSALPDKVLRTTIFDSQVKLAGRLVLKREQIRNLLAALLGAHEITVARAATALGVATASANGALMQAKRVLDVEGYEVLLVERGVVRLDVAALKEQFGVSE